VLGFHVRSTDFAVCWIAVPDSEIVVGEFEALLVTVTLPCALPADTSLNAMLSFVDWFGARMIPAVAPLWLNPRPVISTREIVTFEFPRLVSVTPNELSLFTFIVPKFKPVGLAPSSDVAATPVPLSEIVNGDFETLLVSETEPVLLPVDVGANTALKVALLPAAITVGTVKPSILKPVPEMLAREIAMPIVPVLLSRMVCESLSPVTTLPKLAIDGVAESAPATPVPDKPIVNLLFDASLVITRLPTAAPKVIGAKWTVKLMLFPAETFDGVVRPLVEKPAPVTVIWENVMLPVPVLLSLTV
jgi:hypothetical protein